MARSSSRSGIFKGSEDAFREADEKHAKSAMRIVLNGIINRWQDL